MRRLIRTLVWAAILCGASSTQGVAQDSQAQLAPIRVVVDSLVSVLPEGTRVLVSAETMGLSRPGLGKRLSPELGTILAREHGFVVRTDPAVCPPCIPEGAAAAFWLSEPRIDSDGNVLVEVNVHTYAEGSGKRWLHLYGSRYVLSEKDGRWSIVRIDPIFTS